MLRRLWSLRGPIAYYTQRELIRQYKGSALGFLWIIGQPLGTLGVYLLAREVLFRQTDGSMATAMVSVFCGVLCYRLFSSVVGQAPGLVSGSEGLVKRIVFPLEIVPLSTTLAAAADFAVGWALCLLFAMAMMGASPSMLLLPVVVLPLVLMIFGVACLLSAAGVFVGDLRNLVPIVLHLGFFVSPVLYPVEWVPAEWRTFFWFNPLTAVIEAARAVLLDTPVPWQPWLWVAAFSTLVAVLGLRVFERARVRFADVL